MTAAVLLGNTDIEHGISLRFRNSTRNIKKSRKILKTITNTDTRSRPFFCEYDLDGREILTARQKLFINPKTVQNVAWVWSNNIFIYNIVCRRGVEIRTARVSVLDINCGNLNFKFPSDDRYDVQFRNDKMKKSEFEDFSRLAQND